ASDRTDRERVLVELHRQADRVRSLDRFLPRASNRQQAIVTRRCATVVVRRLRESVEDHVLRAANPEKLAAKGPEDGLVDGVRREVQVQLDGKRVDIRSAVE